MMLETVFVLEAICVCSNVVALLNKAENCVFTRSYKSCDIDGTTEEIPWRQEIYLFPTDLLL